MVATVKGAAEFERGTNTDVARAAPASAWPGRGAAHPGAAQNRRGGDQGRDALQTPRRRRPGDRTYLNIAVEAYPNLRHAELPGAAGPLAESENRIANARRD